MKNSNYSQPYRSLGFDKIDAPNKKKETTKSTKTVGEDLRIGGKKR
ncbi:MAG: hypothetical protein IKV16_01055 [Clostridia bacterium]|nr:hypothetical protein [Clostridia bacterium]